MPRVAYNEPPTMKPMSLAGRVACVLSCLCCLPGWLFAPTPERPVERNPGRVAVDAAAREPTLPTIRVDVDVVNVLCTVKDRKEKLVNTLAKEDFKIFEDGQRQQIRYFSRETNLPLTVGLLVDTSVSQWRLVPAEQEAGEVFFRRVIGSKDLAFLISFDTHVDLLQDLTGSHVLLRRALERLRVNSPTPAPVPTSGGPFPNLRAGGTHLYDAVFLAAREKLAREVGRKAIVVISDGEDQGSKVKRREAIEAAQKADVVLYGILFLDPRFYSRYSRGGYSGDRALRKMSEQTGGRMIRVERSRNLPEAFKEISRELRSQYSLGYTSSNSRRDGKFRKLRIKTRSKDLRVQARKGYYATGKESP